MQEKVEQMVRSVEIATKMAQLRHHAGITQKEMADKLGVTQPTISKLESSKDGDLTLDQIMGYVKVTGQRICLQIGKPPSDKEAVILYANGLKSRLEALTDIANESIELRGEIKGFLADAFWRLFNIIAKCNDSLIVEADDCIKDVRMEIMAGKAETPNGKTEGRPSTGRELAKA
jgi:transcriptional regulator with XRE-family HTH domain